MKGILILYIFVLSGCAIISQNKVKVQKTTKQDFYLQTDGFKLRDGNPAKPNWRLVFADSEGNEAYATSTGDVVQSEIKYLQPMYVIDEHNNFLNVIEYSPSFNLNLKKGKIEEQSVKWLGWIEKTKVLEWNAALKDEKTGFDIKAVAAFKKGNLSFDSHLFIENDSLLLFSSALLEKTNGKKIAPGAMLWIYKYSADKKNVLVGNSEQVTPDNISESVLGWISAELISIWGTRPAFKLAKNFPQSQTDSANKNNGFYTESDKASFKSLFPADIYFSLLTRGDDIKNIYPLNVIEPPGESYNAIIQSAMFTDVLDYSKNIVFNVLGKEINDTKFRKIVSANRKLNMVFVADGTEENRQYYPSILAVIQQLRNYISQNTAFSTIKMGAVVFDACSAQTGKKEIELSDNENALINLFSQKGMPGSCSNTEDIPLYDGIIRACRLFNKTDGETNVIIVVGSRGNTSNERSISDVITNVARVQARLLFFQSQSKASDKYNDFVLHAQQIMSNSARNIAELKKMKIVDINAVLPDIAYKATASEGMYMLDYPEKSMVQGIVLFPKKGEVLTASFLNAGIDTLLMQINVDNKEVNESLTRYFKSRGIKQSFVGKQYQTLFDRSLSDSLPSSLLQNFHGYQDAFFIPVYKPDSITVKDTMWFKGVLLSTRELDKMSEQYAALYRSALDDGFFSRRKALNAYSTFVKKYRQSNQPSSNSSVKKMTLSNSIQMVTGLSIEDSMYNNVRLADLRKKKVTDKQIVQIWRGFKLFADNLRKQKSMPDATVVAMDKKYYWITTSIYPVNK